MEIRPILSALMRSKTGAILVASQVALSLAILVNALPVVSLRLAIAERPSGLSAETELVYLTVRHLANVDHAAQLARQRRETDSLRAVGGVSSVAWTTQLPMAGYGNFSGVVSDPSEVQAHGVSVYVTPDSLVQTFGLKLVEGRDFNASDRVEVDQNASAKSVNASTVIVARAVAEKVWPGVASVVGKTLFFNTGAEAIPTQIIGVVERLQTHGAELGRNGEMSVIVPTRLTNGRDSIYVLRAGAGQRERVIRDAEAALRASSATPLIINIRTVDQDRVMRYRADKSLAGLLAGVSLLLLLVTASGIVGMASLWVIQRRKQIGVRRALGARRVDILRYFLVENFMITSVGIAGGVLLAAALNQLLVRELGMMRLPIGYVAGGAGLFWLLGALAVFGPAWRAATISPATATRSI